MAKPLQFHTLYMNLCFCHLYLELPENFQNTYYELWGDNLRFGVSPMIENRYYWYAVKMAPAKERENPNESKIILKEW